MVVMVEKCLINKQEKRREWGDGPWVDEPDFLEMKIYEYECIIKRIYCYEGWDNKHLSLGHLCGYVKIPKGHYLFRENSKYYYNDPLFDDIDVHQGITFDEIGPDGSRWIGFDCAHSCDSVPSLDKFREGNGIPMRKSPFFNVSYKTVEFVKKELENLVVQIIKNDPKHIEKIAASMQNDQ